ncbi:MAG: hypothetical protein JO093_11405 [Acidobacteria bacterium]|nr:hypothetical protein [Acidobacteriota bacterium]MBV9186225.1 hypothetical protein [Acidobacteriota bacterium]
MRARSSFVAICLLIVFTTTQSAGAFYEDLCLPRPNAKGKLSWCLNPTCAQPPQPNRACPQQIADFFTVMPGRSMVHADSTYFIALALGYRSDVAYWIAAYNEVTDYAQYVPIDQCGKQAANINAIKAQKTLQTSPNTGRDFITANFNGFQRTNQQTDGPLDHYTVSFSPNGQGTDVHGAGGVQALYPLHYPTPGYPVHIDDTYQKTLANMRGWAMLASDDPGVLCVVGLTGPSGQHCMHGATLSGIIPMLLPQNVPANANMANAPVQIDIPTGPKVLNITSDNVVTSYTELKSWLDDKSRTTGTLWKAPTPTPVPVQIARIGIYLHVLQDTSSHSTYCGDDAPTPPGGGDPGTYMYESKGNYLLSFGTSCATSPHLAGHIQETGTGDSPLPLRDYVALNNTVDELIAFGNNVALAHGWIANPELLPPDVVGGRSEQGPNAADLKNTLIGTIVKGTAYSRAEVYKSGVVTLPLQKPNSHERLTAMNKALADYGEVVRKRAAHPETFVPFEHMPGNSADPLDESVCWKPLPAKPAGTM